MLSATGFLCVLKNVDLALIRWGMWCFMDN